MPPTHHPFRPLSTHLILVTCHAIYIGPGTSQSSPHSGSPSSTPHGDESAISSDANPKPLPGEDPTQWLLSPFQTDEHHTFIEHIRLGIQLLLADPESVLVFSGGHTRPSSETERSEAESYLALARARDFFLCETRNEMTEDGEELEEKKRNLEKRILLEEMALDSFGNLLNGMITFWRSTGSYPQRITIVSHKFKESRFEDLHCRVLGLWAGENSRGEVEQKVPCEFRGVNPRYMDEGDAEYDRIRARETNKGEIMRGYNVWMRDRCGVGEVLRGKREGRDFGGGQEGKSDDGLGAEDGKKVRIRALFENEDERKRSGIKTNWVEFEGRGRTVREEVLVDGSPLPWAFMLENGKS